MKELYLKLRTKNRELSFIKTKLKKELLKSYSSFFVYLVNSFKINFIVYNFVFNKYKVYKLS